MGGADTGRGLPLWGVGAGAVVGALSTIVLVSPEGGEHVNFSAGKVRD